jgi:hypothetical protein
MTNELPDIACIAAMIDIPWEAAADYARNGNHSPTFADILKARAKLQMMQAEELVRVAK